MAKARNDVPVPTKDRIRNAAGTAFSGRARAKPKATPA
jgi:hypothetical protein